LKTAGTSESKVRSIRGLDYFSYQPWFQSPGYLSGLSEGAQVFYSRYLDEYGEEMSWVTEQLQKYPE